MFHKLSYFVNTFLKASKEVNSLFLSDIDINPSGLRKESFDFLKPFFEESPGEYPDFPKYIDNQKIRIGSYPDRDKPVVINGRHRLLLSKEFGVREVQGIYSVYSDDDLEYETPITIIID